MNKYHNKKARTLDGVIHHSKKEARRWNELLLLERAGEIYDLKRQVKFVLIPAQRKPDKVGKRGGIIKGELIERECTYIADFVYFDKKTGEFVVEDTKGYKQGEAYALFAIKRKLMLFLKQIKIKEI